MSGKGFTLAIFILWFCTAVNVFSQGRLLYDEYIEQLCEQKPDECQGKMPEITLFRPNYFIPISYTRQVYPMDITPKADRQQEEIKTQLSFKIRLPKIGEYRPFAFYTQRIFWQAYNLEESNAIRETNYNPGVMLKTPWKLKFAGSDVGFEFALDHKSNGHTSKLSRNQFRFFSTAVFSFGKSLLETSLLFHIKEQGTLKDNPDIEKYEGYNRIIYSYSNDFYIYSMLTGNVFENTHGFEFDFGKRIFVSSFSVFLHWYNGYTESLIDYDRYINRVGVGFVYMPL